MSEDYYDGPECNGCIYSEDCKQSYDGKCIVRKLHAKKEGCR